MKPLFNFRVPSYDAHAINETIRSALASAGITADKGGFAAGQNFVDVVARTVEARTDLTLEPARPPRADEPKPPSGSFEACLYAQPGRTCVYKLYVPARVLAAPPLLVMLHGCTQTADDFAAGTRMNRLAEEHGFLVVYPEQAASANPSKCWNWFKAQDQVRDAGEPALIAGIVREVAARHGVDPRRIFVAGLSAGAAMAVILGQTYPELFAGVGAHSGLPYGSAHDIPSALAAMKGGRSGIAGPKTMSNPATTSRREGSRAAQAVPTIVFHGDRDHTVQLSNSIEIAQQATNAHASAATGAALRVRTEKAAPAGGRRYSRTVHVDAAGQTRVESWTVHGAGHAWAGGSKSGTYTDASGPDASAEMLRFFLALPRAGSA